MRFHPSCYVVHTAAILSLVAFPVLAEDLSIPGSGNPEFVLGRLAEAFNRHQSTHRVSIPPSTGIAGAIRDVTDGTAVLGRAGRALKDEERSKGLVFLPLGRDPVVFVGGAGVSVRNISRDEAIGIFSGAITNWKELGGKPGAIRVVGREVTDASRQAIGREIKAFATMSFPDTVKVVHLDPQKIDLLDRYSTSLGFLNRSALLAAKTGLVVLSLDGVEATPENVASRRYPLWLDVGLIHRKDRLTEGARVFLAFVDSPSGQDIVRRHGIIPAVNTR